MSAPESPSGGSLQVRPRAGTVTSMITWSCRCSTAGCELSNGEHESHIAELSAGVPYFREVGVEHDVTNINDFEYAFIEIEFK